MSPKSIPSRLITGSLLASLAVASLAPAANAGNAWGHFKKFRRDDRPAFAAQAWGPRQVVEVRRHSDGVSTLAGFLGGIAVGAILTNAAESHPAVHATCAPQPVYDAPAPAYDPPPAAASGDDRYSYEDPYCHERFASLDVYMAHDRRVGHHPLVAQVIDNRDGRCIDVIRWDDGRWQSCGAGDGGGWNDEDDDGN